MTDKKNEVAYVSKDQWEKFESGQIYAVLASKFSVIPSDVEICRVDANRPNQIQGCGLRGLDRAGWLADKICNGGDYAKEAAMVLVSQAKELSAMRLKLEAAEKALSKAPIGTKPEVKAMDCPNCYGSGGMFGGFACDGQGKIIVGATTPPTQALATPTQGEAPQQANDAKAQEDANYELSDSAIDANKLEKMAKEKPNECFLKGSGILKLTGAIRQLEQVIRNRDAENWRTIFHLQRKGILPEWVNETPGHVFLEDSLKCVQYSRSTKDRPLRIVEIKQRTVMNQDAIDAAIQGMQTWGGE